MRRSLPIWGRMHIDRQLPFLAVYRRPTDDSDFGTERFVMGEASYLKASANQKTHKNVSLLTKSLADGLGKLFGAFLIIEIWAGPDNGAAEGSEAYRPGFRIHTNKTDTLDSVVSVAEKGLKKVKVKGLSANVEHVKTLKLHPPDLRPLIPRTELAKSNIHYLGIEIKPIYRNAETKEDFPLIRRSLHRGLARALKQSIYEFTQSQTTHRPANYQALGPRSFAKSVWQVDEYLAKVSGEFDFLLNTTPTNTEAAWTKFKKSKFQVEPKFSYRPLSFEPSILKRMLFEAKIELVADPVLARLFLAQQNEIDRKITMLTDRGTERFLYGSLQLYGGVDDHLLATAESILKKLSPRSGDEPKKDYVDAAGFAKRAEQQLDHYRALYPEIKAEVKIRDDFSGLMVSKGNLLIGKTLKTPKSRVEALIAHEVDTHIVTYYNGRAQPFKQLYVGLPNYDELQEGLAVLSEYFVGGLSRSRMRLLAARVVTARALVEGASFVDAFRLLNDHYKFKQRVAFGVTMRIYRGGGFTKDAIYLRGLLKLLEYLQKDGDIDSLFLGKFGIEHVPIIKGLQSREVLKPLPLRPHYLDKPETCKRLEKIRNGGTVFSLVEKTK